MTNTKTGARDYYNIEGAIEFASDYTKIRNGRIRCLDQIHRGSEMRALKRDIIECGADSLLQETISIGTSTKGHDRRIVPDTMILVIARSRVSRFLRS